MTKSVTRKVPVVTLIGPPNSGKTTLFNSISGSRHKTVNYPGSTVEYSICRIKINGKLFSDLLDSPGIISLLPGSPDEQVTVNALYDHPVFGIPNVLVVTVDASQFSRHLLLVKQLLHCGFEVIIALTMNDILKRKGFEVNSVALSFTLGCEVVKIDGRTGEGKEELLSTITEKISLVKLNPFVSKIEIADEVDDLINIYREIEQIESKVISKIDKPKPNVVAANKELVILDKSPGTINAYHPDAFTLKFDRLLLHRHWGLLFFFLIMSSFFTSIYWLADPLMGLVDDSFSALGNFAVNVWGDTWYGSLIKDGLINGAGSVLVFLPQIVILFLVLGLLEDSGYLARGAMLIDKPLSKIGLNGKSFVPMLSGFACAIPAMMAARTITNKRERLLTIFILPLMSCSARLPVYALLIAFLVPIDRAWLGGIILAAIYIFSISSSVIVAAVINKFSENIFSTKKNSSFILELPTYKKPKLSVVLDNTFHSSLAYIKKAGPVIFSFSILLWILTYFPNTNPQIITNGLSPEEITEAKQIERVATSYAADLGKIIQPVMSPIGMDWRVGVSLISAFAAREVFVSSLALIFRVTSIEEDAMQASLINAMQSAKIEGTNQSLFTTSTIMGLIVFFVFALQCVSTLAVSRKETGSWKIPVLQLFMFTTIAYILTYLTVNGLRLFGIS